MRARFLEVAPGVRRALLIAVLAGTPLIFLRPLNDPINVPKLALLSVGVVAAAALRTAELLQGAPRRTLGTIAAPAGLLAGALAVAWAFSPYRSWALLGDYGRFQGFVPYLLTIALGVLLADAFADRVLTLLWAFVTGGAIMAGYAIVQVIGADPFQWSLSGAVTRQAVSTVGNPNFTGGYLAIALPAALALPFVDEARSRRAWRVFAVIVLGWLVARSEGGLTAGIVGCALVLGTLLRPRWEWARGAAAVLALGVAAVAVGAVVFASSGPLAERVPTTVELRRGWWASAWAMTLESPFVGRGPNTFALEGVAYRSPEEAAEQDYQYTDDPHSVPLSLLAGAGLLGGLAYAAVAGWTLWRGWERAGRDLAFAALFAGVMGYVVQSLFSIDELSLRVALWTAIGGVGAALASSESPAKKRPTGKKGSPARKKRKVVPRRDPLRAVPVLALLALLPLASLWWAGRLVLADARIHQGSVLFAQQRVDDAQVEYERALDFRDESMYRHLYGVNLADAALRGKGDEELFQAAEAAYAYTDELPDVPGLVDRAKLYAGWAELTRDESWYERAAEVYERAAARDRFNPLLRAEAAAVYLELGDPESAEAMIRPVARDGETRAQVWGVLALALAQQGDEQGAREAADLALTFNDIEPYALQAMALLEGESDE